MDEGSSIQNGLAAIAGLELGMFFSLIEHIIFKTDDDCNFEKGSI